MKRYIKKEWKLYLNSIVLFMFSRCSYLGLLYLNMLMLDYLIAGDLEKLLMNLAMSLGARYAWLTLKTYAEITEMKLLARLNTDIRNDINGCLANMSYKKYTGNELGVYQSWLMNDITKMDELGFSNLFAITHYCIDIVLGVAAQCFINPLLLLTSLAIGGLTYLSTKLSDSKMKDRAQNVTESMEVYAARARECLAGLFVLRSFNHKDLFTSRMTDESERMESANYQYGSQKEKYYLLTTYVGCILGLVQTVAMCLMIIAGWIPLHIIFGGGNILSLVGDSLNNVAACRIPFVSSKVYFDKVRALRKGCEAVDTKENCETGGDIEFSEVSFAYDTNKIFDKFSYCFNRGKKYAVIGKSGTGKSTLLKMLTGYIEDYAGRILVNKQDIKKISERSLFRNMTYIAQDTFLFNDSIINNITMGDDFTKEEIDKAIEKASLTEDIKQMEDGVNTIVGENGNLLSGGQKQRVGLARAFLHNKKVLLIDEGTSALDHKNAERVVDNLLSDKELTVLFVSHTLSDEKLKQFDEVLAL